MARNRGASVAGILMIILLLTMVQPSNAAELSYNCSVSQGFNFQNEGQVLVGHIESIKIGDETLTADFPVCDPQNPSQLINVVGVVSNIYWAGGYAEPIQFSCQVSTANKNTIATLLYTSLSNTQVQFKFSIYNYDPSAKVYFKCFHTNSNDLQGVIQTSGGQPVMTMAMDQSQEVSSPKNYAFTLGVMPQDLSQSIYVATSQSNQIGKQWGVSLFQAVSSISNVPSSGTAGTQIDLTGATVNPNKATNKTIAWSVKSAGTTGVTDVSTGKFTPSAAGTLEVIATIADGTAVDTDYEQDFTINVSPAFKAVSSIGNVPSSGTARTQIDLTGATVNPNDATNKTIVWSVKSAGTTGATDVSTGKFTPSAAGTLEVTATIADGTAVGTDYKQDYTINVSPAPILVTGISVSGAGNATTVGQGSALQMSVDVLPTNVTDKSVTWSVVPGTGTATIGQTGLLTGTGAGSVTVKAAANDGSGVAGSMSITVTTPVTATSTPIAITSTPTSIEVPLNVTNPSLTVTTTGGNSPQATLPLVQVNSSTALGNVQLNIPDSTTVTGPSGWNGNINLPTVRSTTSVIPPATTGYTNNVQTVIEVGYGDVRLTFDKAVRLLIPGQAGQLAGYSRGGVFTSIPKPAGAQDSQTWADNYITTSDGDYAMDVNSDLVIWTKHFTQFVTYSQTPVSSSGGGGGVVVSYTPVVLTEAAKYITADAATLKGNVTSNGGYDITGYGFLWGTSAGSLTDKLEAGVNNQSGAFTANLSSLTPGKSYYFKAYAANSKGTTYGAVFNFSTLAASQTTNPTTTVPNFSDVSDSFWGCAAISSLSRQGIVAGYPDGTFKPDELITRAQFATMLVKALRLNTTGTTSQFKDVNAGDWYYGAVNAAVAANLVSGTGDKQFAPNALVTREQMAVMGSQALGNKAPAADGTELDGFSDKSAISSWAVTGMEVAVKAGIIRGMTNDVLAPQNNATRAQAAVLIYQLINILGE